GARRTHCRRPGARRPEAGAPDDPRCRELHGDVVQAQRRVVDRPARATGGRFFPVALAGCSTAQARHVMKSVRIGAGLGFYGDSWLPIRATLERGAVQYIASDHLSELTLAILRKDMAKDPLAGYTRDVVPMLTALWPLAAERGVRFVLN